VVINPVQARELLAAVTYISTRGTGRHLMALYACMYYAALRPAEAVALCKKDCHLPEQGWGTLTGSRPEVNTRWPDGPMARHPGSMTRSTTERPKLKGPWGSSRGPFSFQGTTCENALISIPRISRDQRPTAAFGGIRLHMVIKKQNGPGPQRCRSGAVP
jgi:hypothetical protein